MTYKAFLKELGIKLKQQRKKLELNQSELIEKINKGLTKNDDDYLSEKQLSRVECGKKFNKIRQICKMVACVRKNPGLLPVGNRL